MYLTITETRDILRSVKDLKALFKGLIFGGSSILKKSKLRGFNKNIPSTILRHANANIQLASNLPRETSYNGYI